MADWLKITAVEGLKDLNPFTIKKKNVLLVKTTDGVHAVEDCCSHEQARLSEGDFVDGDIVCPKHGARFDPKTGAVKSLPALKPIKTIETKVENGQVFILI